MLHTNCEQFVAWMDAGVHDMKLHFSLSDQSEDYTVQDSEYEAWGEDHVQVWVQFHWLTRRQPTTTPTSSRSSPPNGWMRTEMPIKALMMGTA